MLTDVRGQVFGSPPPLLEQDRVLQDVRGGWGLGRLRNDGTMFVSTVTAEVGRKKRRVGRYRLSLNAITKRAKRWPRGRESDPKVSSLSPMWAGHGEEGDLHPEPWLGCFRRGSQILFPAIAPVFDTRRRVLWTTCYEHQREKQKTHRKVLQWLPL